MSDRQEKRLLEVQIFCLKNRLSWIEEELKKNYSADLSKNWWNVYESLKILQEALRKNFK